MEKQEHRAFGGHLSPSENRIRLFAEVTCNQWLKQGPNEFDRDSFLKRVIELKILLPKENKHRNTFVIRDYEDIQQRRLDLSSAVQYIEESYLATE
mgnify:CR=1 FL=1